MTKTDLDFDEALSLIEELSRGLSQADASASELSRRTIRRASDFLAKHGWDGRKFE